MKYLFLLFLLYFTNLVIAQQDTGHIGNVKIYLGKEFNSKDMAVIRNYHDSINNTHIGETYVPFFFNTLDGENLTNESVKGKVLFIAFWYETCHCWDYKKLEEFYNSMKDNPDFKFVAVTFEGNLIQEFLAEQHVDFPIARIRYERDAQILNYHNGFPSFIIIDKEGKVAALSGMKIGDTDKYGTADLLKLCATTTDLLIK